MKVIKYGQWALAFVLPLVGSVGNAALVSADTVYPYSAPNIVAPSWPLFLDKNETIQISRKGSGSNTYWTLVGRGSTTSLYGSETNYVDLGKDSVKYQANFNSAGQLITSMGNNNLSNFLEIKGSLPAGQFGGTSWAAQPNQLLLKATLLDSDSSNNNPDLIGISNKALGFKTLFTGGWAANNIGLTGGSTGESLWLFSSKSDFKDLVKALDGDSSNGTLSTLIGSSKTFKNVASVSAVPVPGAVWLFGTGLLTFLAGRRKSAGSRLN